MPRGRYNRDYKARHDKQQAKLDPKSPSFLKEQVKEIISVTTLRTGNYACPFCLHSDTVDKFLISTKQGYHKGLGKCPECSNQMQLKTLFAKMTPEEFAEFAFGYASDGYWNKVPFSKFNRRLQQIGWLDRFWTRYKELKGDSPAEKYQDYLMRHQEEEAKEKGWIPE